MDNPFKQIAEQLGLTLASSVNEIANTVLSDVEQNVQVKSGRLRDSYQMMQTATPEDLTAIVDSPLNYKLNNYPFEPNPRANAAAKLNEGESEMEALARQLIEDKVNQTFQ